MSEAKKAKKVKKSKSVVVANKTAWESLLQTVEAAGGSEFHTGGRKVACVSSVGGLLIGYDSLNQEQAIAFANWILAWFGTEEAKP